VELLLHAPEADLPAEWDWCPDCAGAGRLPAEPEAGSPADECWTCRGLGGCTDVL